MKPRRENGATFVSPMTSDVCMGSALMIDSSSACGGSAIPLIRAASPSRRASGARTALESWISRGFLKPNLAPESGRRRTLGESRIQQAIAAERKSPACEDAAGITAACLGGGRGYGGEKKNKGVGAGYRLRACQPRKLKSTRPAPEGCENPRVFPAPLVPFSFFKKIVALPFTTG